jgi:predicted NBD/HSP70 family sugar kinase
LKILRRLDLRKTQAARINTIRDINRQIVLNYIREREPISRAEIAREADLQRSTISAIVEALTAEGLVEEVGEGESTGGRRPTMLRLRTKEAIAIGVAITPTCTTVATSDLAGRIVEQREFLTDPDPGNTLKEVIAVVREFSVKHKGSIEAVGVSLPGLVDPSTGTAVYVPFFKWRDIPIAKTISTAFGLPVIIDNDANAVALAELWFGRPEVSDARDFILVLVAEGVGTGIIFDGQVYRGQRGAAGEFGHMVIGTHAPVPCSCGNRDCWEAFASERAAVARYAKLAGENKGLGFKELVDAALLGEADAKVALTDTALCLGVGISNLVVGFSPEAVVVGGEIARAWPLVEKALKETIEHSVRRGLPSAKILPSTLGEKPTLRGALSLVLAGKFAAAFAA